MPSETISLLVEGGKASPGPAMAQKLGPIGISIPTVLEKINKKTEAFKGMQVPVKLKIDSKTKDFDVEVGTPPTSQLIKKELNLEKGSGQPQKDKVANISIEQCIKIAKMKKDAMFTTNLKKAVKSVIGSCNSLGVLVEGKIALAIEKEIDSGKYDLEIKQEKIEPSEEKKKLLGEQLKLVQEEIARELAKKEAEKQAEEKTKEKVEEKVEPAEEKKEPEAKETKEVKKEEKPKKEEKKK